MMVKKIGWHLYRSGLHGEERFGAESDGRDGSHQSHARLCSDAIGPLDPAQLITLRARLSNCQQICLLVPAHLPLPLSLLNDVEFKQGCKWGYCAYEDEVFAEEVWSVPKLVNYISLGLCRELLGERDRGRYAWVVGFLLGNLTGLAETERTLALVGMAHLCFLLSYIPLDVWSCNSNACVAHMEKAHQHALRAYRAHVRLYREQGKSFQEAQRLALAGCVQEEAGMRAYLDVPSLG